VDGRGHLWVATWQGLHRYDGQTWETQTTAMHALPSDRIYDVLTDANGNLWIGTDRGLQHLDVTTGAMSTYDHVSETGTTGLVRTFTKLALGPDGTLWAVAGSENVFEEWLVRLDGDAWTSWPIDGLGVQDL